MDAGVDDPVRRAFDASYRRLVGQLYGVCGSLVEAEEAVAEAFARAVASRRAFERAEQPEAWLRTVAVNVARTRHRRRMVADRLTRDRSDRAGGTEQPAGRDVELSEDRLLLVAALRALPAPQREALALHYLADLPVAEVADTLGVAVGTVKARLSRGRTALAAQLAAQVDATPTVPGGTHG